MMPTPDAPDAELIRRIKAGDQAAFRRLFDRYSARLTAQIERQLSPAIRRKLGASDVLQDAYLVALEKIAAVTDPEDGGLERWLRTIVDMKTKDAVRRFATAGRRSVVREVSRDGRPESGAFPGRAPTPSQEAMAVEKAQEVRAALARLPEDYREVLVLLREHGYSLSQVAERIGRSVTATQKVYERALARLAEELAIDRRS